VRGAVGAEGGAILTKIKPVRVQRKRMKGFRMVSPNGLPVVCVTRGTPFGNPFSEKWMESHGWNYTSATAVEMFKAWLIDGFGYSEELDPARAELIRRLPELRGKNLACFCSPEKACHASVLLRIANATEEQ
jgi:hypothetical protein